MLFTRLGDKQHKCRKVREEKFMETSYCVLLSKQKFHQSFFFFWNLIPYQYLTKDLTLFPNKKTSKKAFVSLN
jgi:hypothetical protein